LLQYLQGKSYGKEYQDVKLVSSLSPKTLGEKVKFNFSRCGSRLANVEPCMHGVGLHVGLGVMHSGNPWSGSANAFSRLCEFRKIEHHDSWKVIK
jgi:hypothetical protein